jgi:hypothetical protein
MADTKMAHVEETTRADAVRPRQSPKARERAPPPRSDASDRLAFEDGGAGIDFGGVKAGGIFLLTEYFILKCSY